MHLLIVAKEPLPGRAKTRLVPRFGPEGSARLARAALADTLATAACCAADRVIVAFDGDPCGIVPRSFEVVPQGAGDLAARLTDAWRHAGGPGFQIGMDTPQLTASDLDDAFDAVGRGDAALGPATDGGWWGIGFRRPPGDPFAGIETSRSDTGIRQLERLLAAGLATTVLPEHRDVDEPDDVELVAALAPHGRFAAVAEELLAGLRTTVGGAR